MKSPTVPCPLLCNHVVGATCLLLLLDFSYHELPKAQEWLGLGLEKPQGSC